MFFKKQNKVNLKTHKKAGFSTSKRGEKIDSRSKKDQGKKTTFSSKVVDTSFVYFEEN